MNDLRSWVNRFENINKSITLDFWEEYTGLLLDIIIEKNGMILHFSNNDNILIPNNINLKNQLKELLGCRIAIIHTDLQENEYKIRNAR